MPRRRARSLVVVWAAALVFAAPARAVAKPMEAVSEAHPGHHHAEYPNLLGVRVGYLSILTPSEGEGEGGVELRPAVFAGLSYERTLIHEWLELEVSVPLAVVFAEDTELALPMDLHLKKPFHPSPRVSPYLALGPTVDLTVTPELRAAFGASFAVGTYLWPTPRVGVDVELDYNLVAEAGRPVHELLFAVGPVFRL